jgi:hypothetical protein
VLSAANENEGGQGRQSIQICDGPLKSTAVRLSGSIYNRDCHSFAFSHREVCNVLTPNALPELLEGARTLDIEAVHVHQTLAFPNACGPEKKPNSCAPKVAFVSERAESTRGNERPLGRKPTQAHL